MKLEHLDRGFPGHPLHPPLTDATTTTLTGFADWLQIARSTPLWRTATTHMIAMLIATALFLVALGAGYSDGMDGAVADGAFTFTLAGYAVLTVGGWLGGSIVFNYGMRVLNLVEEPARRAVPPVPKPEEEAAEKELVGREAERSF